jgi:hypothetical protein
MNLRAKVILGGLFLAAAFLFHSEAQAQFGVNPWGYGYGGGWGGWGGGTAEGNYLQGMSTVIRSAGEYNLYTSQAGVNNEETRSRYLDNKKKWQENYLQLREQRSAIDAQKREQQRQSRDAYYAATKSAAPAPMSPVAMDAVTGQISWPDTLLASDFEKPRKQLEQLFELRAKTSGAPGVRQQIHSATEELARILRTKVEKIPANEYMAARKFIDELDHTARAKST